MASKIDIQLNSKFNGGGVKGALAAFKNLTKGATDIKSAFSMAFGSVSKAASGVGSMIKSAFKFEKSLTDFKVLLGNIDAAKTHVAELKKFAASTPLTFGDLSQASRLLLSFGSSVDEVMPSLKTLGDIALGDAQKFQGLALVFAQVKSQGKLMGQDLLQMVNQGFNPLTVISKETGKSMGELKDMMSEGRISFEMVAEAMRLATGEGGLFNNAMKEASSTGEGLMSTLKDNWSDTVRTFGEAFSDSAKDGIGVLIEKLQDLNEDGSIEEWADKVAEATQKATGAFGSVMAKLRDIFGLGEQNTQGTLMAMLGGVGAGLSEGSNYGGGWRGFRKAQSAYLALHASNEKLASYNANRFNKMMREDGEWTEDLDIRSAVRLEREENRRIAKLLRKRRKASAEAPKESAPQKTLTEMMEEASAAEAEKAVKAAEKVARKKAEAEKKAAEAAAKERERLDLELHQKRMQHLRDEMDAASGRSSALTTTAQNAASEFDRAFAMYRDPAQAASVIGEEQAYQNDLKRLHRDASRYGGKWRIDELSRLMAAGDSQGVTDTLQSWRKSRSFTPEVEAMVRASAAERTKTTAEEELRKIENNTANLDRKLDELLAMKG